MPSPIASLHPHRPVIACLLLLAYLPACTSWRVGAPTPAEFVQREQPKRVRVTQVDGSRVILLAPSVQGDSLAGQREGVNPRGEPSTEPYSVPLGEVQSVAVRKFSAGRTLLLVGGVVWVVVVAWVIDCTGRSGWDSLGCP